MPVWDIGSLSNMQMRICVHCTNSFISSKKGVITFYMLIYINNYYHALEIFIDLLSTHLLLKMPTPALWFKTGLKIAKQNVQFRTMLFSNYLA